jgi:hypothetical protein
LKFGLEAKLGKLSDQALGFLSDRAAIIITTPEILMFDAVLEHLVDCNAARTETPRTNRHGSSKRLPNILVLVSVFVAVTLITIFFGPYINAINVDTAPIYGP